MADTVKQGAGLRNVVAGESSLSWIDGERGILTYRGIDIHSLAEQSTFEEVVFLLHRGRLPARAELAAFAQELARERAVPAATTALLRLLPPVTHPMTSLRTAVSALGGLDPDANDDTPPANVRKALRLTGQMATVVALVDRVRKGRAPVAPDPSLSHAANFLLMLTGDRPRPEAERAMDMALILHADHEFNASTFAARVAASTLADIHGAITAALATLKGPLHGGANEAVLRMLDRIGSKDNIDDFLKGVKDGKERLMGFGHRVYKNYDPRARIIKNHVDEVFEVTGTNPKLELAIELEKRALDDDYFTSRKLYPNVDFYSGLIYEALSLPTEMFTVMFAIPRTSGWIAQWLEMIDDSELKIARPRQIYTGERDRDYVQIEQRS